VPDFGKIISRVLSNFTVAYVDFEQEQFLPYKERRIGGVVRRDTREILLDKNLSGEEEDKTWIHEILSIHYYLEGVLKHDYEIERETCLLHQDRLVNLALHQFQDRIRRGQSSS